MKYKLFTVQGIDNKYKKTQETKQPTGFYPGTNETANRILPRYKRVLYTEGKLCRPGELVHLSTLCHKIQVIRRMELVAHRLDLQEEHTSMHTRSLLL